MSNFPDSSSSSTPGESDFDRRIEAVRRGDEAAINELFERYYATVRQIVHRGLADDLRRSRPWLGALFSTGDVVQEVFISVLRDLDTFSGDSEPQFVSFLATVTKSRLVDAVRFHEAMRRDRRRVGHTGDASELVQPNMNPADAAVSAEELGRFCAALTNFPERERLLLRRRLDSGATFDQLAQDLGYPSADAARKAFHAAQARLATRLSSS